MIVEPDDDPTYTGKWVAMLFTCDYCGHVDGAAFKATTLQLECPECHIMNELGNRILKAPQPAN